ncbi:MAG TPA: citrate synthase [Thermoanaerobaculia bacterium]|nr:citrate synthase [Thermoanaerobaculia bacterium]
MTDTKTQPGLDGVVVAQTVLSEVDGEAGRLIVRGHPIEELAGAVPFEEVARRLWEGLAPASADAPRTAAEVRAALGQARSAAFANVAALRGAVAGDGGTGGALPAVPALRLGLASLRSGGADHILATAAIPVFVAAFERTRRGLPPVAPDPALGPAADFLRMLRGEPASGAQEAALDAYLVTVAEHGMNASTFTARVVASTRAGVLPAVIAALCALEGPLHGGAPGPVLDMLDAVRRSGDARAWLAAELAAGRRLMGFGHRIYRVRDPRADVLKAEVAKLRAHAREGGGGTGAPEAGKNVNNASNASDAGSRLALAEAVEREALAALAAHRPGRRIDTNVEFYTAVLLDALRIDRGLFTSVFAAGRAAGWTAHVFEQEQANRLIRPQSEYVGPR